MAILFFVPVGDAPVGNEPVGNEPVGKLPVGKLPVGKMPVGNAELCLRALPWCFFDSAARLTKSPVGWLNEPVGKEPVGKTPVPCALCLRVWPWCFELPAVPTALPCHLKPVG